MLQLYFATNGPGAGYRVAHQLEVLEVCSKMILHVLVLREDNVAAPDNEKDTGRRHVIADSRFGHNVAAAAFVAANPCGALGLAAGDSADLKKMVCENFGKSSTTGKKIVSSVLLY